MCGARGDAVTIRKGFLGGQGGARLEDPALDGTAEVPAERAEGSRTAAAVSTHSDAMKPL